MITIATVGTTHPLGIAGLGLDLRVAARLGARVVSVVAGVSAQDAAGVRARAPIDPALITAQFAAVRTAAPQAAHVGALLDADSVATVAREVAALGIPVVVDPVLAASAAPDAPAELAGAGALAAIARELVPRATLITPNAVEAARLLAALGEPGIDGAKETARRLVARGAGAALVTGGDGAGEFVVDVLARGDGSVSTFTGTRLVEPLRGTGDLLALALAVRLGAGDDLDGAIESARAFVRACILRGESFAGTRALRWEA